MAQEKVMPLITIDLSQVKRVNGSGLWGQVIARDGTTGDVIHAAVGDPSKDDFSDTFVSAVERKRPAATTPVITRMRLKEEVQHLLHGVTCEGCGDADWRPFPTRALPAQLEAFVKEAAAAIGCDESFVALPLLAGLAASAGNTRRVRLKSGWCEPMVLWTAIVAGSGQRKSPPFSLALKPLREIQEAAMKEHDAQCAAYKAAYRQF
jgi:hypothetical protein